MSGGEFKDSTPAHYRLDPSPGDCVESWDLGFWKGNALKYLVRAGRKKGNSETEDLKKAADCIERRITELEKGYAKAVKDD